MSGSVLPPPLNPVGLPGTPMRSVGEMHLMEHLKELRLRIIVCAASVLICACIAYGYVDSLFVFLSRPYFSVFDKSSMIGTGPAEAFLLKIQIAVFAGVVIALPILFYQLWLFIAPGLHESEKKFVVPFVASTTLLFLIGVSFCYTLVLPIAFGFFHDEYTSIGVTPAIKIGEHLSFISQVLIAFGVIFELPVLAFILGRLGLIDYKMLIGGTRYAVVIIFIVAAVLTPPDVLSQMLMAIPMLILYGVSIIIVKFTARKRE